MARPAAGSKPRTKPSTRGPCRSLRELGASTPRSLIHSDEELDHRLPGVAQAALQDTLRDLLPVEQAIPNRRSRTSRQSCPRWDARTAAEPVMDVGSSPIVSTSTGRGEVVRTSPLGMVAPARGFLRWSAGVLGPSVGVDDPLGKEQARAGLRLDGRASGRGAFNDLEGAGRARVVQGFGAAPWGDRGG
jgi:hypothetical protein